MKRRLFTITSSVAVAVYLLMTTIALADPPSPFESNSIAIPLIGFMSLTVSPTASTSVVVGIGSHSAALRGQLGVVESEIAAGAIFVQEDSAVISATTTFFVTSANTLSSAPQLVTESQQITSVSGLLVDTGVVSSFIRSRSQSIRQATGASTIEELILFGDPTGTDSLLTAELITSSVDIASTVSGTAVTESAALVIQEPSFWLRLPAGLTQVVSADLITSTASTSCDSAGSNEAALNYGFNNLRVAGAPVNPTPGTVITVSSGAEDVAVVSISSMMSETTSAIDARAEVLPLTIQVITGAGSLEDGAIFYLGTTGATCSIPEPTAVRLSGSTAAARTPRGIALAPLAVLALITGVVLTRRRG